MRRRPAIALAARTLLVAAALSALPYTASMAQNTNAPAPGAKPAAPAAAAQEVPVTSVMLFSSGVGYFEHNGSVSGNGSTELRFKTEQINDILKSLVLQDMNGGVVSTVTYPSQDPIEKTLRSFQVDITGNPSLGQLLNQLRGARVSVTAAGQKYEGTVLGVEPRTVVVGEKTMEKQVLNLLAGGAIRAFELDAITTLDLENPELQEELSAALAALAQARDQDKKPVTINFRGQGERQVRIGYVVETPVWKTSYRLIVGEGEGQDAKNGLQGWAIVENQTDNDWSNVNLSLVSGRPISFIMDLYQPLYVPRPVVQPELYASLRPQMYDEGMAVGEAVAKDAMGEERLAARVRRGVPASPAAAAPAPAEMSFGSAAGFAGRPMDASASVQSVASAEKVGELFSYTVGNVSLPRQKSAMLPIITDPIKVEKLSIYNAGVLQKNPLNGARLTNSTDKHLLSGPITVLEGGAYAGDARIDNVPPGQNRLLSYGIDLQMRVDSTKNTTDTAVLSGRISQGVLYVQRKYVFSQTYQAENKADKDKALLIEHPVRPNWKLVDSPTPEESTEQVHRFKTSVPAGKQASMTIKQENVAQEAVAILPLDVEQLLVYARTGEIPQPVRDALAKAAEHKRALNDTQRQLRETEARLSAISTEQGRIRQNMQTVNDKSEYYNRLLKKLNEQESQIEQFQTQRDQLQEKQEQQRAELENFLKGLNVG